MGATRPALGPMVALGNGTECALTKHKAIHGSIRQKTANGFILLAPWNGVLSAFLAIGNQQWAIGSAKADAQITALRRKYHGRGRPVVLPVHKQVSAKMATF